MAQCRSRLPINTYVRTQYKYQSCIMIIVLRCVDSNQPGPTCFTETPVGLQRPPGCRTIQRGRTLAGEHSPQQCRKHQHAFPRRRLPRLRFARRRTSAVWFVSATPALSSWTASRATSCSQRRSRPRFEFRCEQSTYRSDVS